MDLGPRVFIPFVPICSNHVLIAQKLTLIFICSPLASTQSCVRPILFETCVTFFNSFLGYLMLVRRVLKYPDQGNDFTSYKATRRSVLSDRPSNRLRQSRGTSPTTSKSPLLRADRGLYGFRLVHPHHPLVMLDGSFWLLIVPTPERSASSRLRVLRVVATFFHYGSVLRLMTRRMDRTFRGSAVAVRRHSVVVLVSCLKNFEWIDTRPQWCPDGFVAFVAGLTLVGDDEKNSRWIRCIICSSASMPPA
jgi:hypothetical protein